jgi:2-methylcitrate dehydratase PrpD
MDLTARRNPTDSNKAGTSMFHWAAAALIHRAAGLAQGANDCVLDPKVIALSERVNAAADPSVAPVAVRAEIRLKDGRVFKGNVSDARGSVGRPLTKDELSEKFLGQAELIVDSATAKDILARSWSLIEADDVKTHLAPLFVAQ